MTSKLTREFMQNIISGHGFGVAPSAVKAMAEFIVAAMDSEPVILYRERNPYNGLTTGWQELTENEFSFLKENAGENAEFVTLYRHAQQPVVRPDPECQHQWRYGGANKLQNQKQCIKCGRVELDAQPAPEYPETLPCPVLLEPGMRFGKGVKTRLVLDAIQRRAEHYAELGSMTPEERAEHDANIEAFKAMLPQPAPVVPECFVRFHDIIKERHYGRMPEEVQNAFDECAAMLQAGNSPVVPDDYQRLRELYHAQEKRLFKIAQLIKGPAFDKYSHSPSQAIDVLEGAIFGEIDACRAAMLQELQKSAGVSNNCRSNEKLQAQHVESLTTTKATSALDSLPKNAESRSGNSLANDTNVVKRLTITLPDTSSKAFWSGTGKTETFHPVTYRLWVKEAIERYCAIARIDVEVK